MPPRPSRPTIRYRSVRIVPGVKPPAGMDSDEICRTAIGTATTAGICFGRVVGNCEGGVTSSPQDKQNRLSRGITAEHDRHWRIEVVMDACGPNYAVEIGNGEEFCQLYVTSNSERYSVATEYRRTSTFRLNVLH